MLKNIKIISLSYRKNVSILFIIAICISLVDIIGVVAIGEIVAFYANETSILNLIDNTYPVATLFLIILAYTLRALILFVLFNKLGRKLYSLKSSIVSNYVKSNMRLESLELVDQSDLQSAISTDAQICSEKFLRPVIMVAVEALVFVGIIGFLLFNHLLLSLVCFVALLSFGVAARIIVAPLIKKHGERRKVHETRSFKVLQDIMPNKNDYYRLDSINAAFINLSEELNARFLAEAKNFIYGKYPRIVLEYGAVISVAVLGYGLMIGFMAIETGTLATFVFAIFRLIPSITKIASNINDIAFSAASIEKLLYAEKVKTYGKVTRIERISVNLKSTTDPQVDITSCEPFAIIGPSGVGKSYFVQNIFSKSDLLRKNFSTRDATGTQFEVKPEDIDFVSSVAWYNSKSTLVEGTLHENIALSQALDMVILNEIKKICVIDFLNDEFTNNVKSQNLSDGQIQRILVARALYGMSSIIVLDEPTSALDETNARVLLENLCSIKDKMIIVITHDVKLLGPEWKILKVKDRNAL